MIRNNTMFMLDFLNKTMPTIFSVFPLRVLAFGVRCEARPLSPLLLLPLLLYFLVSRPLQPPLPVVFFGEESII